MNMNPRFWAVLFAALAFFVISCLDSVSEATEYKRGSLTCIDFEEEKARFEILSAPDPEFPSDPGVVHAAEVEYAMCLIAKGEDHEGLIRLRFLSEQKDVIPAAYIIAQYEESDGTFEKIVHSNLDNAISAYGRVLVLIDFVGSQYPRIEREFAAERGWQMELNSNYRFAGLHFSKFTAGLASTYNKLLLNSPNYKGDRDITIYPEHLATVESLKKTLELASRCLSLPKKDHFHPFRYQNTRSRCQILKDMAFELLPMERKRLELLQVCRNKLPDCPEEEEQYDKMMNIYDEGSDRIGELWDAWDAY